MSTKLDPPETKHPWEDSGDNIVVDKQVSPDARDQPFETYFYRPVPGYGYSIFLRDGIGFIFPEDKSGTSNAGCLFLTVFRLYKIFRSIVDEDRYINAAGKRFYRLGNQEMLDLSLDGRTIEICQRGEASDIEFRFAADDGERLYGELDRQYPSLVARQKFLDDQIFDKIIGDDGF